MSMEIIRVEKSPRDAQEAYIAAMFLMFARAPRDPNPDVDGMFELGEVGSTPEKSFERLTPYSLARPIR